MLTRFVACLLAIGSLLLLASCATDNTATPNPAANTNQSTYPSTYTAPSKSYGGGRY